ncbi:MAG: diacylglycerol kinase family protein [Aeromicrobium sp.]|uniref:diacylglycerol kinase family protein n=1 Tax=Aeromicrobium sp. TaxID=1871063 RepID=UPI003C668C4E
MSFDLRRATPERPAVLLVVLGVLGAIFTLLAVFALNQWWPVGPIDEGVALRAFEFSVDRPRFVDLLNSAAVAFSTVGCIIGLVGFLAHALWQRERRIGIWIVASGATALAGNALLKLVFRRERPLTVGTLNDIGGYSFPSGHAAGAGMFFTVAILVTIVLTGRGWRRRILIAIFSVLGLFVAASRVLLGVHWTSDVAAGLVFGVGVTLGLWVLIVSDTVRFPTELAMLTGAGTKQVAVVLNPIKVGDVEDFKTRTTAVAAARGWSAPLWFETTIEDIGHGQAAEALRAGVDLIVAAGGDGTVRAVCEEAAKTGIAVGILPHGTGNLLARNLSIPLNTRDALDVVFDGQDKAIDLGAFGTDTGIDTSFLVMAGLGMDAAIMTGVNDQLKEKVGWLAYFVSGVKAARYPAMKVQIAVDDGEFKKFRARTVVIGNVGFLQGGIPLLPDAQIDDGQLDVVVLAPKRFLGWLAIIVRVMGRQKRTNDRLDRLTGHKVVIKAERPVPMQLDGDAVGEGKEIHAEVQPGVLLVRVPLSPVAPVPQRW